MGEVLVLPQNEVSDFVDSPWEALPFLRSEKEQGGENSGAGGGEGVGTGIAI